MSHPFQNAYLPNLLYKNHPDKQNCKKKKKIHWKRAIEILYFVGACLTSYLHRSAHLPLRFESSQSLFRFTVPQKIPSHSHLFSFIFPLTKHAQKHTHNFFPLHTLKPHKPTLKADIFPLIHEEISTLFPHPFSCIFSLTEHTHTQHSKRFLHCRPTYPQQKSHIFPRTHKKFHIFPPTHKNFPALSLLFSHKPNMPLLYLFSLLLSFSLALSSSTTELASLMAIKASLDPHHQFLTSWTLNADPCSGSFEGVACNELGKVANISLQGKGLYGQLPREIAGLKNLTGLYLHFNALSGVVPREIGELKELSDLYLNVNNLTGEIPTEIGNMTNLQVLQLCYNKLSGSIPTQLGSLKKLSVLALQYNQLTGAIPASLGDLGMLTRLDLSFNSLFGSIPTRIANAPMLEVLDIQNNTLSGNVSPALMRLSGGFQYENNLGLCGVGFSDLKVCTDSDHLNPNRPEPFGPNGLSAKDIPESAKLQPNCNMTNCSRSSTSQKVAVVFGVIAVIVAFTVTGLFTFSWYRRRKQKIGSAFDTSDSRLSTDQVKEVCRRSASPLISLEYSNGWDPLAKGRSGNGYSQEVLESFMFNLEDVERATQSFSEVNLLGKSNFSAIYKGILRDGSVVAIKCIAKTSCKSDEAEFLKGLKILTSLKHENLVRLRGFCCSKGRGECFLIYDFVPNGNLLQYLDVKEGSEEVLEWSTRISIINGITKGIGYLHGKKGNKPALVHQNISAGKVLIDHHYNPLLSDSGLHKLLADDIVFSMLKASAAMGYLAPEYTTTGRFTEKSDIYAFGMIVFQILVGKRKITQLTRHGAELCRYEDFIDSNLEAKFSESEAAKLGRIALLCTHESPNHRPAMENVMQELSEFIGSS